jgi:hypothetical protein
VQLKVYSPRWTGTNASEQPAPSTLKVKVIMASVWTDYTYKKARIRPKNAQLEPKKEEEGRQTTAEHKSR